MICDTCGEINCYTAEYSPHISSQTLRCVVCGSPWGGFGPDGNFYCTTHMVSGEEVLS